MQKAIHTNQMLKQFGWRISLSSAAWILSSSFYIFLIWFHIRTISKVIIQLLLAEGIIPEIFWFEYANVSHHIQNILYQIQFLTLQVSSLHRQFLALLSTKVYPGRTLHAHHFLKWERNWVDSINESKQTLQVLASHQQADHLFNSLIVLLHQNCWKLRAPPLVVPDCSRVSLGVYMVAGRRRCTEPGISLQVAPIRASRKLVWKFFSQWHPKEKKINSELQKCEFVNPKFLVRLKIASFFSTRISEKIMDKIEIYLEIRCKLIFSPKIFSKELLLRRSGRSTIYSKFLRKMTPKFNFMIHFLSFCY